MTGKIFLTSNNFYSFTCRRRSELLTTLMLEKAIAPAAIIGINWRKNFGAHVNGANIPAALLRAPLVVYA